MLSRVADSLYWLGRYSERTETNTHILATHIDMMLELNENDGKYNQNIRDILKICGYIDDYEERYTAYTQSELIHYVMRDPNNYNAITEMLTNIRNNARNARDILPNDLWSVWNEIYLRMPSFEQQCQQSVIETTDLLLDIRRTCLTATGVVDSLMSRDESFMFLKIGKWLERAEKTALLVFHLMASIRSSAEQEFSTSSALKLTDTYEEYSKRYRNRDIQQVLNFLIGDDKSTHSVFYGIKKIKKTIFDIENGELQPYASELFDAITEIERLTKQDAYLLSTEETIKWVDTIRNKCTLLGPIFSQTYYLTPPILVDEKEYVPQR